MNSATTDPCANQPGQLCSGHSRFAVSPYRHHQRIDESDMCLSLHGPAHGAPGKEVQHDHKVEPVFRRPDAGEIGEPLLVRPARLEVTVEDVVGDDRSFSIVPGLSPGPGPRLKALIRISRSTR